MAKLTYFNIIMLGSLLTALNMQAFDAPREESWTEWAGRLARAGREGAATALQTEGQVAEVASLVETAKKQGAQEAAAIFTPVVKGLEETVGNLAANLQQTQSALATTGLNLDVTKAALADSEQARMLTEGSLSAAQTFGGSLATLKSLAGEQLSSAAAAAQAKLAPYWAKAEPYTQYVTGPASTVVGSLARAATTTGGTLTGGIESLTNKEAVKKWLSLASTQEFLKSKLPANMWNYLASVDRQTYDMIAGAVALAIGTYLAGKGLAYGYNYLTAGPTVKVTGIQQPKEPGYLARQANETLHNQIGRLINEENQLKVAINTLRTELKDPLLSNDQKDGLLSAALAYDTELALLTNKINQLRQEEQQKLQAQLAAQPAAQPVAPQPGFFSRMRANLPPLGMPSFLRRAQGPQFATKSYANLSELQQLEQSKAELNRLQKDNLLTSEEKSFFNDTIEKLNNEIASLKAKMEQEEAFKQNAPQAQTGWRSYLPSRPSLSGIRSWFSQDQRLKEPTIERTGISGKFQPGSEGSGSQF